MLGFISELQFHSIDHYGKGYPFARGIYMYIYLYEYLYILHFTLYTIFIYTHKYTVVQQIVYIKYIIGYTI